jgi:NAD(P)-dependent dehydrogenase (short-subunit alcohol dehydrogenase family)
LVINKPSKIIYICVLRGIRTGIQILYPNGEVSLRSRFPTGITANAVSPGNTYFPDGIWNQIEGGNPDLFNMAMGLNPTGRMGTAEEIAAGVVFLSSPVASRISGTNLLIDGALTKGMQF